LPLYVVDASVAVKWCLQDEEDIDAADALLDDFLDGRIHLLAPDHIRYEVPSAVRNALRTDRLTETEGQEAIAEFLNWPLPTVGNSALIQSAYEQALRFGCALYDGLYLALAGATGGTFVHADNRLRNSLGDRFPRAMWLTDYEAANHL
jgi:predicted nucleic acid-binding protein